MARSNVEEHVLEGRTEHVGTIPAADSETEQAVFDALGPALPTKAVERYEEIYNADRAAEAEKS